MIPKYEKKKIHQFVELVELNPFIDNTLHFNQYSRVLNIFWFSADNLKTKLKLKKKLSTIVCRACRDKSIEI